MTRRPPHLPPDEEAEGETYHNIALQSIDEEEQGRFARPKPHYTGEKGNQYPKLNSESPLVTPQPDAAFDPSRDCIDPQDVSDMKFGVDLFGGPPKSEIPAGPDSSLTESGPFSQKIRRS